MTVAQSEIPQAETPLADSAEFDIAVIGGGIVGLATAYRFTKLRPGSRVVVIEKERTVGAHQTGHNSGVLHSGIYYKPGSLKATNCRRGHGLMVEFCHDHAIPFDVCGKVIVATDESELPALEKIYERGTANGIVCEMTDGDGLRAIEPHCAGIKAIRVPEAGIVDYVKVCETLAELVREAGGQVRTGAKVTSVSEGESSVSIHHEGGHATASIAVNCAGLHSDRVARLAGTTPNVQIMPFRGEYYILRREAERLVNHLIYPVPDPRYPFLGVHFTRMIQGGVECGPNAVLALAREGYTWHDVDFGDLREILGYAGFWAFAKQHWKAGLGEVRRSLSKARFVASLQKLVPEITSDDITPGPAGVRAQAITRDGKLLDDFSIIEDGRLVHVCNAPSPAATSSLSIGDTIAQKAMAVLA